jgi:hypothetical protein
MEDNLMLSPIESLLLIVLHIPSPLRLLLLPFVGAFRVALALAQMTPGLIHGMFEEPA